MDKTWAFFICLLVCNSFLFAQKTQRYFLSGQGPDSAVAWDFYCTKGQRSGQWTTIRVPSNWELEGFGGYNYGRDRNKSDEQGFYRTTFRIPEDWNGQRIRLVFEGVMTDTLVRVNGTPAGEIHQGGFYEFSYEITDLVKPDSENRLEVEVSKVSANASVEQAERMADYWVFGGIYRPVYLEAVPAEHIVRTAIDARADGLFRMDVYLDGILKCDALVAQILDDQNQPLGKPFTSALAKEQAQCTLQTALKDPQLWTAETPHLYTVQVDLKKGEQTVHTVQERFGFRTFEVHSDGLFLNNRRIVLKGVNRHSFRPESGRCLGPEDDVEDVRLIKSMNMNAVRCSHYPPNRTFLQACDELGLYVLDELAGWQKPPYETKVGRKLVKEMVTRDVNHPSILFWDNGNEGGWNTELDSEFALYDPQRRPVLHPWEKFSGIDTDHYETYDSTLNKLKGPLPFLPTEFLHGLYDGGLGAGLADYWAATQASPFGAGGFLWAMVDEGVVRTDKEEIIDTDGNNAPDGIVGPYHEKEGSFYAIREVWSPVQVSFSTAFDGSIRIKNGYDFTNLNKVQFTWRLVDFVSPISSGTGHIIRQEGTSRGPNVEPREEGTLRLDLPAKWRSYDAFFLTATDTNGHEIWTWSIPLKSRTTIINEHIKPHDGASLKVVTEDGLIRVTAGQYEFAFGAQDGLLRQVISNGRFYPLANGPRCVPSKSSDRQPTVSCVQSEGQVLIQAQNSSGLDSFCWTLYPDGRLKLEYTYALEGVFDHFGITFDVPESSMLSMRWLGQGPCRVWKNRLQGGWLDVWQRDYNQGVPGYVWQYPVFSGYYADLYWLDLRTQAGSIRVFNDLDALYFRVGELRNGPQPMKTKVNSIDGDLSFLHAIAPIGSKFNNPSELGPSGQKTTAKGTYRGKLIFRFD
jgi:hypothetical protein